MPRIFAAILMLATLAAGPAWGQVVPEEAEMDLWCGTAFELMTRDAPADATTEKLAAAKVYADGGAYLVSRALPIYLESGYTNETLEDFRADLAEAVGRAVNGTTRVGEEPAYSFQDCSALIGQ